MTARDPKARLTNAELRLLQTNGSPVMQSAATELLALRDWLIACSTSAPRDVPLWSLQKRALLAVELAFARAKEPK